MNPNQRNESELVSYQIVFAFHNNKINCVPNSKPIRKFTINIKQIVSPQKVKPLNFLSSGAKLNNHLKRDL